jgi:hypothetical protein
MISPGYESALFDAPISVRCALARARPSGSKTGTVKVINEELQLLRDLRYAARAVRLIVNSTELLFDIVNSRLTKEPMVKATRLGTRLLHLSRVTQEKMEQYFPNHGFNPYVRLLFEAREEVMSDLVYAEYVAHARGDEAVMRANGLNGFVEHLRKKAADACFQKALDSFRRACDKNTRSIRRYIDSIFRHRGSKQLVIRLDLAYAMEDAWAAARPTSVTLDEAKDDLRRFQRYLRDNWPLTGFAAKLEYGLLRGYHFHVLIFLNGHVKQQDILNGKRLGEYWQDVICEGKGRYWNCNAQNYPDRGIGMIHRDDGDKRGVLIDKVAGYLTKTDFWMRFQPGGRTFFKGVMPEPPPVQGRSED